MAEQLDEQTMQELADFDKKKPARRGRAVREVQLRQIQLQKQQKKLKQKI